VISFLVTSNIYDILMMTTKGKPISLIVHPILMERLLKLEFREFVDPDYGLPEEDLTSPAVRPPVPELVLENRQGYPQRIGISASGGSSAAVTVEDVLDQIHEVLRRPSTKYLWDRICDKGQKTLITASFRKRNTTEEERGKGLYAYDYLCGRDRLQIVPGL